MPQHCDTQSATSFASRPIHAPKRFERFSLALCFFSLLLVPVFLMVHPPLAEIGHDLVVPRFPADAKLSDVLLLVIAIGRGSVGCQKVAK
jgi:Mn2+/Fe2+ NRAMP family transporter